MHVYKARIKSKRERERISIPEQVGYSCERDEKRWIHTLRGREMERTKGYREREMWKRRRDEGAYRELKAGEVMGDGDVE